MKKLTGDMLATDSICSLCNELGPIFGPCSIHSTARQLANEYGKKEMKRYEILTRMLETESVEDILASLADVLTDDGDKIVAAALRRFAADFYGTASGYVRHGGAK